MSGWQYNAYHTIHPSDTSLKGWTYTVTKMRRSNSWSESYEDFASIEDSVEPVETGRETGKEQQDKICLLDDVTARFNCEVFKKAYANILCQLGLHEQRVQLMKYIELVGPQPHVGLDVSPVCCGCGKEVVPSKDRLRCSSCRSITLRCIVCRLYVRGVYVMCVQCRHGGHLPHITDWFTSHSECPTACGCHCPQVSRAPATEPFIQLSLT